MIALLTAYLFFEIFVHVLNIASAKARAKTVFGHLKPGLSSELDHSKTLMTSGSLLVLFHMFADAYLKE